MDRFGVHTKTEAVDLALRHLAGQPMSRDEALAMRGAHAIDRLPDDARTRGPLILVDSSAWVEYDRATGSAVDRRVSGLFASEGEIAITEPIVMEVTAGARDDREGAGPAEAPGPVRAAAIRSGDRLRRRHAHLPGVQAGRRHARGMLDCMIASVAARHAASVLALDADFARMAAVVGIPLDEG